jgi:hypothetical protein
LNPPVQRNSTSAISSILKWRGKEYPLTDEPAHHRTYLQRPNIGRIYDYVLGGSLNTPGDRKITDDLAAACPQLILLIRSQRSFLTRAVECMLDRGVRQFIDLGSGLPTAGHIHSIARSRSATASTVYVDNDPGTVAHAQIVLTNASEATAVHGDLTEPDRIITTIERHQLLDRRKPTGVLLVGTLDLISRLARPATVLRSYRGAFPDLYLAATQLAIQPGSQADTEIHAAATILDRIGSPLVAHPYGSLRKFLHKAIGPGSHIDVGYQSPSVATTTTSPPTLEHAVMHYTSVTRPSP